MRFHLTLLWLLVLFVFTAPGCLDRGTGTIEIDSDSVKSSKTLELKSTGGESSIASGQISVFMSSPSLDRDTTVSVDSYDKKIFPGIALANHLLPVSDYHVFTFLDFKESKVARVTLSFDTSKIDTSLPGNIDIYQFNSDNTWKKLDQNRSLDLENGLISAETGSLSSFVVALYLYDPIIDTSLENYIFSSSRSWKSYDGNGNIITTSDSQGYNVFVSSKSDLTETESLLSCSGHQSVAGSIDVLKKTIIINHSKNTLDVMNISGVIVKSIDLASLPFTDPIINITQTSSSKIVLSAVPSKINSTELSSNLSLGNGLSTCRREIFMLDPESSMCERVTYNDVDDYAPAWSIDGKKIYFLRVDPLKNESRLYCWDLYSRSSLPVGSASISVVAANIKPLKNGNTALLIPSGDILDLASGLVTGSFKTAVQGSLPSNLSLKDVTLSFEHGSINTLAGSILNYLEITDGSGVVEVCCTDSDTGNSFGSILLKIDESVSGQQKMTALTEVEYIDTDIITKNGFSAFGCTRFNH